MIKTFAPLLLLTFPLTSSAQVDNGPSMRTTAGSVSIRVDPGKTITFANGSDEVDPFVTNHRVQLLNTSLFTTELNLRTAITDAVAAATNHSTTTQINAQRAQNQTNGAMQLRLSDLETDLANKSALIDSLQTTVNGYAGCASEGKLFSGSACVAAEAAVATEADLIACNTAALGRTRFNRTAETFEVCAKPPDWTMVAGGRLGTNNQPAQSCAHVHRAGLPTGPYWIVGQDGAPFRVFCDNDSSGGGWTLIIKVDRNTGNRWLYESTLWTSRTNTWNANAGLNLDVGDFKSKAYGFLPFTQIRMAMGTVHSGNDVRDIVQNVGSRDSAHALFTGNKVAGTFSRGTILNMMPGVPGSKWNNQPNCNLRGFNLNIANNYHVCRWGIIMNNEGDCGSADAAVGFGCRTNGNCCSDRRIGAGGFRWNPTQQYPMAGWIMVR